VFIDQLQGDRWIGELNIVNAPIANSIGHFWNRRSILGRCSASFQCNHELRSSPPCACRQSCPPYLAAGSIPGRDLQGGDCRTRSIISSAAARIQASSIPHRRWRRPESSAGVAWYLMVMRQQPMALAYAVAPSTNAKSARPPRHRRTGQSSGGGLRRADQRHFKGARWRAGGIEISKQFGFVPPNT
jgi:hypothetical protein